MEFYPRGKPYTLPIACTCGSNLFRRVTKLRKSKQPAIDAVTYDLIRCEKCGTHHDFKPDPADVENAARRTT